MIVAIDVHYREDFAKIVAVEFNDWTDNAAHQIYTTNTLDVAEYEPGAFYKRELPCIIEILQQVDLEKITHIVIDGYVYLDDAGNKGLGAYVYEHYDEKIPVIGVAKTRFFQNDKWVRPILRGSSLNPLYVTAVGMDLDKAAHFIASMDGNFRMPTLLKLMDTLTKE